MDSRSYPLNKLVEILSQTMELNEQKVIRQSDFASLSMSKIHCLDIISHLEKPTVSKLAKELGVSKPSVTFTVETLQEKGFVKKVKSDQDLRVLYIHLTDKGKKIVMLHDAIHKGYARYFEQALADRELSTIVRLLNKVVKSIEERR
jgi:DNA-binding MarR family transcriptional regulator